MKPHLDSLQRMFPQIAYGALQNVLAANEGCMNRTVRVSIHSLSCVSFLTMTHADSRGVCLLGACFHRLASDANSRFAVHVPFVAQLRCIT